MMNFSPSFWIALGNHLWQATLFGLLIVSLLLILKKFPARIRFYIGWIGLLKFVLPSALFIFLLGDGIRSAFTSKSVLTESILSISAKFSEPLFLFNSPDTLSLETRFPYENIFILLGLIWISGSLALFIFWQLKVRQLRNQIKENAEPVSEPITSRLNTLKETLGLKCQVSALLVKKDIEPGVFGVFRPNLILTGKLLQEFSDEELDAILIHELMHIKHKDNLWAHLQVIILCLFWFHPLVWFLNRCITLESEKACDEAVIKYTGVKKAYASAIYKVFQFHSGLNVYGFSGITQTGLKNRIQSILNINIQKDSKIMNRSIIIIVLALLGISMFTGGSLANNGKINEQEAIIEKLFIENKNDRPNPFSDEEKLIIEKIADKVKQLIETKEYNQALEILDEAFTDKSSPALSFLKGNVHANAKEFEKAAVEFEKAIDKYPTIFSMQRALGYVYANLENFDIAREHLLRAIELGGEDAKMYGLVGYSYQLDEEWFIAEIFFREAYKRDPADPAWKGGLNFAIYNQNNLRSVSIARPD